MILEISVTLTEMGYGQFVMYFNWSKGRTALLVKIQEIRPAKEYSPLKKVNPPCFVLSKLSN